MPSNGVLYNSAPMYTPLMDDVCAVEANAFTMNRQRNRRCFMVMEQSTETFSVQYITNVILFNNAFSADIKK